MTGRDDKETEDREIAELREGLVDHVGVPLWRASSAYVRLMMAGYRTRGYNDLSESHAGLLPHLDIEGTRQTVIAQRAGITKQAVGQMIVDLERRGYVRRVVDPADARANLVRYTAKGRRFLRDGWEIKRDLHGQCRKVLGVDDFARFAEMVERLAAALESKLGD